MMRSGIITYIINACDHALIPIGFSPLLLTFGSYCVKRIKLFMGGGVINVEGLSQM
jgi:hypothetical protein